MLWLMGRVWATCFAPATGMVRRRRLARVSSDVPRSIDVLAVHAGQWLLPAEPVDPAIPAEIENVAVAAATPAPLETSPVERHLAARLHAVGKLNGPGSRIRKSPKRTAPAAKPIPIAAKTEPKRRPDAVSRRTGCGVVKPSTPPSALIINLDSARSEIATRRERHAA